MLVSLPSRPHTRMGRICSSLPDSWCAYTNKLPPLPCTAADIRLLTHTPDWAKASLAAEAAPLSMEALGTISGAPFLSV